MAINQGCFFPPSESWILSFLLSLMRKREIAVKQGRNKGEKVEMIKRLHEQGRLDND